MIRLGWAFALLSTSALAGCGSHNHAPVAYGTAPNAQTARIYTSPQQAAQQNPYSAPSYNSGITPAVGAVGLAPLTPVTETGRQGRGDYAAQPIYLAQADIPPVRQAPIGQPTEELPGQVTVLPGDTVYAIARRTGASPQAIIALNSMKPPYALNLGQSVRVPASAVPPSRALASSTPQPLAVSAPARREAAHIVRPGDTLYSISRAAGVTVGELAAANNLRQPYALQVGQQLRVPGAVDAPPREASISGDVADLARNVSFGATPTKSPRLFDWPVQGRVIGAYGLTASGKRNDGVNIAAPIGTPVRAAADGEVVYRGSELEGYGNLLLIKHEDGFVTAYAHNDAMLVKKGDRVRQGQVIAKVGQTGSASEPQLHFEIRQNLKAVDPVALLGSL